MAGAEEEEEQEADYLKMFLGLWAVMDTLCIATAMGFSITTSNGVLAQDLPPITSNCSDMVYFQPVSSAPRLLSLLMCLTTLHDAMECKSAGLSFFQKLRRFTNNAAPASVPVGLHHPSLWLAHYSSSFCISSETDPISELTRVMGDEDQQGQMPGLHCL